MAVGKLSGPATRAEGDGEGFGVVCVVRFAAVLRGLGEGAALAIRRVVVFLGIGEGLGCTGRSGVVTSVVVVVVVVEDGRSNWRLTNFTGAVTTWYEVTTASCAIPQPTRRSPLQPSSQTADFTLRCYTSSFVGRNSGTTHRPQRQGWRKAATCSRNSSIRSEFASHEHMRR